MDSTVDSMAAAYDALLNATAAAIRCKRGPDRAAAMAEVQRCVDAFNKACDRAEGLVQAAAASLGHPPDLGGAARMEALRRAVQVIENDDLLEGANDVVQDEKQVTDEKVATPPAPVTADNEDE